jgi:predicted DCC family thiol-disulfide oxidoreductase YuxK
VHYTLFLVPAFFALPLSVPLRVAATLMLVPVPFLLGFLDAPLWQQVTIGSAYNWAVLLALAGFAGDTMTSAVGTRHAGTTIVFYDGLCGLCDRFVHFLLVRDRAGRLRFAALQGGLAQRELRPAGHDPNDLDTVLVIADYAQPRQRVLTRSRAVLEAVSQLGGGWSILASIARIVPACAADAVYAFIARRRYRLFGRYEVCPLPRPEWRERFLDESFSR